MDDHFTLQWNDYQSHLMSAFSSLRNDKDFVDLTLSCEGRRISSHKMLLSACSPYFRGLLKENPCPHPVIILRQTSYEDLVAIIHFVYNGEVSLHQSRVKSFIKTAKSLKIRGLCEASEFAQEDEELSHSARAGDGPNRKKMKLVEETEELEEFGVASVGSGATGRSSGTGGGGGGKEWATSFDYGTANTSNSNDLQEELGNSVMDQGGASSLRVCKIVPQTTKRYAQKFRDKWLHDPEFEPWLSRHESDQEKAICTVCRKTLNAKLYDLKHHSRSIRHRRNLLMQLGGSEEEEAGTEEQLVRDVQPAGGGEEDSIGIFQSEEIIIKTTTSSSTDVVLEETTSNEVSVDDSGLNKDVKEEEVVQETLTLSTDDEIPMKSSN